MTTAEARLNAEQRAMAEQVKAKWAAFEEDVRAAIDKHGLEPFLGNTPQHIAAKMAVQHLAIYAQAIMKTEVWYQMQHTQITEEEKANAPVIIVPERGGLIVPRTADTPPVMHPTIDSSPA